MICQNSLVRGSDSAAAPSPRWASVVRVKAQTKYPVVSLMSDALLFSVHYYRRRTIPCVGVGCPGCGKTSTRQLSFLAVNHSQHATDGKPFVLELPGPAAYLLREFHSLFRGKAYDSLLGLSFVAFREKGPKSAVCIADVEFVPDVVEVASKVVTDSLCRLWRLPFAPENLADEHLVSRWTEEVRRRVNSEHHYA